MTQAPSPDRAPAENLPDAATPQQPSVWADRSGRIAARCCDGVDIPGAGWQHSFECPEMQGPMAVVAADPAPGEVRPFVYPAVQRGAEYRVGEMPSTLGNYLKSEPLFDLITYARILAEAQIVDPWVTTRMPLGWTGCRECSMPVYRSGQLHSKGCSVGHVLRLVKFFTESLQPNPTENRKEAATAPEPVCAEHVKAPRGLNPPAFNEPWEKGNRTSIGDLAVCDSFGIAMATVPDWLANETEIIGRRIIASVNFCAAFTTEELESAVAAQAKEAGPSASVRSAR